VAGHAEMIHADVAEEHDEAVQGDVDADAAAQAEPRGRVAGALDRDGLDAPRVVDDDEVACVVHGLPHGPDAELEPQRDVLVLPRIEAAEPPELVERAVHLGEEARALVGALAPEEPAIVARADREPLVRADERREPQEAAAARDRFGGAVAEAAE